MNVLVTGGAGFIGSNLCYKLLELGNEVVCFDNLSTGKLKNVEYLKTNPNFRFVKGDANTEDLNAVFKKYTPDYVFHYAAVVGVKRTIENPLSVLNGIGGIKKILELSRKHNIKKIIFSSSSEVYGNPIDVPEKEDGIVNPKMPYAVTKLMGEKLFEAYHKEYGLRTTSLRFFNAYGPKQDYTPYGFVVGIFIKQALQNKPLTIFGDGKQTRDFFYIEDNVDCSIKALESKKTDGEVINVGSGKETTILDLANQVKEVSGRELKIEHLPERPDDIPRRCADITKMKTLLNFTPKFSLTEGLKMTFDWYKNER